MSNWLQKFLLTLVMSLPGVVFGGTDDESGQPNIIFFLVDDLGWQDSSVQFGNKSTKFQEHFRTPNLEKLAAHGIRFSNAYSCAVCSPTRTSIMTGQNAARHSVTNWTLYADRDQSGRTNRLLPPSDWKLEGLQPDQTTLPKLLKSAGYTTIHCGKAHWGAYGTEGADPTKLGFDFNIAGHPAGAPGSYHGRNNFGNHPDGRRKIPWGVPGLEKYHGTDTHLTDALAIEACELVTEVVKSKKPFFLYMAPYAVHTPIQEHPRFIKNYLDRNYSNTEVKIPDVEAKYASMVEGYDAALGQLLETVNQLGVAEDTIIVFTSDNGGLSAHARGVSPYGTAANTHNLPLREGKGSAYEGGTRVPLLISWAKVNSDNRLQQQTPIHQNTISDQQVICEDYLPTLCRWAGVDLPTDLGLDGRDITEAVIGEQKLELKPLIFHYPHVWGPRGQGYQPHSAMRLGDTKLIYFYHAGRWEMYDLANDPGEQENLVVERPKKFREMAELLIGELERLGARYPVSPGGHGTLKPEIEILETTQPVPSEEDRAAAAGWRNGGTWLDQHQDINKIAEKGGVDIVFLGDSITQSWGGAGRHVGSVGQSVWNRFYADKKVANFGISGDRTQNVLWRIQNGNFARIDPKVIIICIGTNNLADNSEDEIVAGVEQVVLQLEEKRGKSKILLMGILPRGKSPDSQFRSKIASINQRLKTIADSRKTFFVDLTDRFVDDKGVANADLFSGDFVHLKEAGYQEWALAIEPTLQTLIPAPNKSQPENK